MGPIQARTSPGKVSITLLASQQQLFKQLSNGQADDSVEADDTSHKYPNY